MAAWDVTEGDDLPLGVSASDTSGGAFANVDSTHVLFVFFGTANFNITAGVFELSGGVLSQTGSLVEVDADGSTGTALKFIQSTGGSSYYLCIFEGSGADGYARVISVNESTYGITVHGTAYEFDTADFDFGSLEQLGTNENHFLAAWKGTSGFGYTRILEVNTSTWAVTAVGTGYTFDGTSADYIATSLLDTTHVFVAWTDSAGDGNSIVVAIDGSWVITAAGSAFEFDTSDATYLGFLPVNSTHVVGFWKGVSGDGFTQVLAIDGSYAITAVGSALEFDTTDNSYNAPIAVDANHFLLAWTNGTDAKAQVFTVNLSTYAVTAEGSAITFTQEGNFNVILHAMGDFDGTNFVNYHVEINSSTFARDPFMVVLQVELPPPPAGDGFVIVFV